jgi:alcohol dehydrogenase class IV
VTQKEYIGFDSIFRLREVLAELSSKRIFLVTGKGSYSACGAEARLDNLLKDYEVRRFCEFTVNPKIEDIERGINIFKAAECDTVIAVGGGSTIDMAKAINFLATHRLTFGEYEVGINASEATGEPLIAIPTTAGSGSEATRFAVVYTNREKFSVDGKQLLPDVVIVDAGLTMSLPARITAVSGIDALSQAIESYWCIHSTNESKSYARKSIELILSNLVTAVNNPTKFSRQAMAQAAHLSGKAINITRTTAAHSVSYPLTLYFGIPHGQAVGLTLSSLLVFNANVTEEDVLDNRGVKYVRETIDEICKLLGTSSAADAAKKIDQIIHKTGLERRLSLLGLRNKKEDIETIVANGFSPDRVKNNPRKLTKDALRAILEAIY